MKILILLVSALVVFAALFSGCSTLEEVFPMPDETADPTPTTAVGTATPLPTLGELEPLDAAYCLESPPDAHELEFTVLRFFASGVVLQVNVKGQSSCSETWEYIAPYLKEGATDIYSHGEYQYSQGQIRFALAPAGSDEMAGEISGVIDGSELILDIQGTQKVYVLVYGGE